MSEFEGALEPPVVRFVERTIRSLLTWDIVVFFHRNSDAVLDLEALASRLGRRATEIESEVVNLCQARVLNQSGGLIRYRPDSEVSDAVDGFVNACQDRGRRLALIALVLRNIGPVAR